MKAKLLSFLKIFAFFCVGLFLLWLSLRKQNIPQIINYIKNAHYFWVFATAALIVLSNYSRAIRWNILIEPTGYKPRKVNTFAAVQIGYFANLAVPRLGEVSRCAILNQYEKVPLDKLIGTVVVERIMDVIALALLLVLAVCIQFGLLYNFVNNKFQYIAGKQIAAFAARGSTFYMIAFAVLCLLIIVGWVVLKRLRRTAAYGRFIKLLKGFGDGLRTIGKLKQPGWFLFHSVFIWFCYTASTYVCFHSFDFSSSLSMATALTIMVFGGLGFVLPVPGATGVYQNIVIKTIMLYGLTSDQGAAFANLSWATQTVTVIVAGILFYLLLPAINRNNTTTLVANETA